MTALFEGIDPFALGTLVAPGFEWTLKAVLILALAGAVARALHRSSAATRHLVWLASLVAVLAVPILQLTLPWQWNVAPELTSELVHRVAPGNVAIPAGGGETNALSAPADASSDGAVVVGAADADPGAYGEGLAAGADGLAPTTSLLDQPGLFLLLIWALGSGVALLMLVRGRLRLARVRRTAVTPDAPGWDDTVRRMSRAAGLDEPIDVRESPEVTIPLTTGIVRREILLPSGAAERWPERRLEAVLLHELAHVRRRDVLSHLVGRLICALQWFNPLVWIASRRLTRECERACDDHVLLAGTRASEYAEHLLAFAREGGSSGGLAPALSMARKSDFEGRILALLDPDRSRGPVGRTVAMGTIAAVAAIALLISVPSARGGSPNDPSEAAVATLHEQNAASRDGTVRDDPDATSGIRESIQESLAGARATDAALSETLLGLLQDPNSRVRAAAARTLGDRRESRAIPTLADALNDEDDEVREEAAAALGRIGDPTVVDALARVLAEDPEEDVRQAAAWALGETESPEAVDRLARALESVRDRGLRHDIVEALGETRQPAAVEVLSGLLDESRGWLQREVLEALVEIDSEAALGVLINAMQSEDVYLRRAAAEALSGG